MQVKLAIDNISVVHENLSKWQVICDFGWINDLINPDPSSSFSYLQFYDNGSFTAGKSYKNKITSVFGNICHYSQLEETEYLEDGTLPNETMCESRYQLQGSFLSKLTLDQQYELLSYLVNQGYRFTRSDVALDVFATSEVRQWMFDEMQLAADQGRFKGGRLYRPASQKDGKSQEYISQCFYLGSCKSSKVLRLYDKELESKGRVKSFRIEGQFRNKISDAIVRQIVAAPPDLYQQTLASSLFGQFTMLGQDANTHSLWISLQETIGACGFKPHIPKVDVTFQSIFQTLGYQWGPNIAAIFLRLGKNKFINYFLKLAQKHMHRISHQKLCSLELHEARSRHRLGAVSPSHFPVSKLRSNLGFAV